MLPDSARSTYRWLYWNVLVKRFGYSPKPATRNRATTLLLDQRVKPPLTENVRRWSESHTHGLIEIMDPESESTCKHPVRNEPEVHYGYLVDLTIPIAEKYIALLSHARLSGKHGLIVLPDGSFALEHHFNNVGHIDTKPEY